MYNNWKKSGGEIFLTLISDKMITVLNFWSVFLKFQHFSYRLYFYVTHNSVGKRIIEIALFWYSSKHFFVMLYIHDFCLFSVVKLWFLEFQYQNFHWAQIYAKNLADWVLKYPKYAQLIIVISPNFYIKILVMCKET